MSSKSTLLRRERPPARFADEALTKNLDAARATNTRRAYESAWRAFTAWCDAQGCKPLPCDPYHVGVYLSHLGERVKPATVQMHAAAIAHFHTRIGEPSPCAHPGVRQALSGQRRRAAHAPKQATGIGHEAYAAITETAMQPRVTCGGRFETTKEAQYRGLVDVCLIGLMRDALLRRSEAAAAVWADIQYQSDSSARLLIPRSKTDQEGRGCVRYVSTDVARTLETLRTINGAADSDRMFRLGGRQICRRISAAASQARLTGTFSGHSPRIGMAQDLAAAGTSLPALMQAGGWKSAAMPAYYVRSIEAGSGAVARWYQAVETREARPILLTPTPGSGYEARPLSH